ncbi:MAG TPA: hypothetical protein VKA46_31595 [Gemmataceae bacterium]|nr:hypothetical protein [Gemmataceae bacterium]
MKRSQMLHAVMARLRDSIAGAGFDCEVRGADCAGPGEYVATVYGTAAEVRRLADALGRDAELRDVQVVEDLGETNQRLSAAADADRRRHLHVTFLAPSLW